MGILTIQDNKIEEVREKMKRVAEKIMDLLMFSHGFMLTTGRACDGDYGVIWLEVTLGRKSVNTTREILEDEFYGAIPWVMKKNIIARKRRPHKARVLGGRRDNLASKKRKSWRSTDTT